MHLFGLITQKNFAKGSSDPPAREKKKKAKEKKEKNYIKRGGKGHKNASFWALSSNIRGRGKNESQNRGWGKNDQNAQYISLTSI